MFNLELTPLLQLRALFAAENVIQPNETFIYSSNTFYPLYGLHPGDREHSW